MKEPAGIVSSATNLALALELYLKSIRAGLGLSVPETHNLWGLYKGLPQNVKKLIEDKYKHKLLVAGPENLYTVRTAYTISGADAPKLHDFKGSKDEKKDIKSVLKRSSNAFHLWRYVYESIAPGEEYFYINLEYSHLLLICDSLSEFIREHDKPSKRSFITNAST